MKEQLVFQYFFYVGAGFALGIAIISTPIYLLLRHLGNKTATRVIHK